MAARKATVPGGPTQWDLFEPWPEVATAVATLPTPPLEPTKEYPARPYQIQAVDAVFASWEENNSCILIMPTASGKCLGRGTPVLMYDGTIKPVESVVVGDLLIGPDSKPRAVKSVCSGTENLYRVVPKKGDPYVVNESHILSVKLTPARPGESFKLVNLSVTDYLEQSSTFRHRAKGWRSPVEWPEREVPVDPYYLGLWLGDGSINKMSVYKPDQEVKDYVSWYAAKIGMRYKEDNWPGKCPELKILRNPGESNHLLIAMRKLGVVGNKHVPLEYKRNSREVRLAVLAGLMDTDGSGPPAMGPGGRPLMR